MELKRAHVVVSGVVQGVSFRAYAKAKAVELSLAGFVRNLPDGDVEVVLEGPGAQVELMIAWCHRGAPLAHVENVVVDWQPYQGEYQGFSIRW
ncbi:MAG TPA: acylphosphatase [Candidatus Bipolaricaulota bacterium]